MSCVGVGSGANRLCVSGALFVSGNGSNSRDQCAGSTVHLTLNSCTTVAGGWWEELKRRRVQCVQNLKLFAGGWWLVGV